MIEMPQIRLQNISKRFRTIQAVDNISFNIDPGEYIVFLGHTGSGKSTVLKIIAGLVKPDSGNIYFDKYIDILLQLLSNTGNLSC